MLGACMIVRNAEDTIERAIASIRPHVDGVFIFDTGSTDDTPEILEALARSNADGSLPAITIQRSPHQKVRESHE